MGKKKSTTSEIDGNGKPKATWHDDIVHIFCDLAAKEVAKGNRPGTHLDKIGWANCVKAFNEITEGIMTKNNWDLIKTDYKLWNSLLQKETGIGWDPTKKTINATAEWWQNKIKENSLYQKFHDVGISHEKMELYDKMFKGCTALGNSVMIPSATIDVKEVVEDSDDNVIFVNDDEDLEPEQRGKKRTTVERPTEARKDKDVLGEAKGKKGRVGGAVKLSKQIDRLVEVVESSIQEVMRVVATLLGAETGTDLWWFATELFCSQEKREMFCVITDSHLKL